MKFLKVIKKLFLGLLTIIFFAFAILITALLLNYNDYNVTEIDGKSLIIIREKISSEKYKKGDIVVVEKQNLSDIKVGDEIFAYNLLKGGEVQVNVGTVDQINEKEKAISFDDGVAYTMDFVAGKATKVYNNIGTPLAIVESTWGFLIVVLIPSFLIFIYQVYELIVEIKYGSNEEKKHKSNA